MMIGMFWGLLLSEWVANTLDWILAGRKSIADLDRIQARLDQRGSA